MLTHRFFPILDGSKFKCVTVEQKFCFLNSFSFHLSILNHCPSIHRIFQPYSSSSFCSMFTPLHLATRMLLNISIYPSMELIFYQQKTWSTNLVVFWAQKWSGRDKHLTKRFASLTEEQQDWWRKSRSLRDAWYLFNVFKEWDKAFKEEELRGHLPFPLEVPQLFLMLKDHICSSLCFFWLSQHFGRGPSFS